MDKTLNRYRTEGVHGDTPYEISVEQWSGGAYCIAEVYVPGLPPRSDDDNSFETLEEAFDAGHAIARTLIGGR